MGQNQGMTGPVVGDDAHPTAPSAPPTPWPVRGRSRRWWAAGVFIVALVLAGCSSASDTADRDESPDDGQQQAEREGIDGDFGEVAVTITAANGDTCELCLLHADTPELRSQGLMEVTDPDLGGYDGMLFDHGGATSGAYWMKNTPMPLSIAYWDEAGSFVSSVDMEPCLDDETARCPSYPADDRFRFALEVTQGGLEEILAGEGSTLVVDGTDCYPRSV